MNEADFCFLEQLHQISQLSFFVYDNHRNLLKDFKPVISPDFPQQYLKRAVQQQKITIYSVKNGGCFTAVGLNDGKLLVIWQAPSRLVQLSVEKQASCRVKAALQLCYFNFYHKRLFDQQINFLSESPPVNQIYQQTPETQRDILAHSDYLLEIKAFEAIQNGNLSEFQLRLNQLLQSGKPGTLVPENEVRNLKDVIITGITLLTRAVIKGGMLPEIAYEMSDISIQNLEKLTSVPEVITYMKQLPEVFIEKLQATTKYSDVPVVFAIQEYVFKHLTEKITLNELATAVGYSKNYLTRLFKEKTGLTISSYIRQQKILEAKNQLASTNRSISKIAVDLGFVDQSHLTKVFNHYEKMTPQEYRKQCCLLE